jgi:F-type H+-transporting ATPase subunit gamma
MDDYTSGLIDAAYISYTQFVTTLTQRPVMQQILPVEPAKLPKKENVEYIYEPDAPGVLAGLLPRFVEMEIYHAILEAIASEQSARMVAMRNATDNAKDLVSELTLMYNKARQEAITKELLDITAGVSAVSGED